MKKSDSTLVVDETVVKIGGDCWYLYVAISPKDRRIAYAAIYPTRNYLTTKSFFREMIKKYGKKPEEVIVGWCIYGIGSLKDSGSMDVLSQESIRNYIERWFQIREKD